MIADCPERKLKRIQGALADLVRFGKYTHKTVADERDQTQYVKNSRVLFFLRLFGGGKNHGGDQKDDARDFEGGHLFL